ncbi:MarC family NAAT transporter [uncultured Rhodoblastus sp.]|uniref:MarC family NAAT transporter n=1 Tax=uncultured Rhodoblastus sp. TaxID=543037 RepID=UPI0025F645B1|nr:MarC family NAAT transporter [uncultured Rhodoblastus sp.]
MTAFRFFELVLLAIAGLLPIMNPFSTAPLLIALTAGMSAQERARQTLLGCLYAFGILATFLIAGRFIISFFGISLPGIRIAGGLLISTLGFRMVFPPEAKRDETVAAKTDIAFSPLAMPSLSGPGSISVVLATSAQIPDDRLLLGNIIMLIGIGLTTLIAWLVLSGSFVLVRFLGPTGIDALTRIFGFLLICIGVQFVLIGTSDYYLPLLNAAK